MSRPDLAPFEVLGVSPNASDSEISAAYKILAQIFHPDRFHASPEQVRLEAEARMKALNDAYRSARRGWLLVRAPESGDRSQPRRNPRSAAGRKQSARGGVPWTVATASRAEQALKDEQERLAREKAHSQGQAVLRPRTGGRGSLLRGLGVARYTNNLLCPGCDSVQWLPPDWRDRLDDSAFYCSFCDRLIFTR